MELFLSTFWHNLGCCCYCMKLPYMDLFFHPNGAAPGLSLLFVPSLHLHVRFLSFPPSQKLPQPVLWFPSIPSTMISLARSQSLQISSMLCNAVFVLQRDPTAHSLCLPDDALKLYRYRCHMVGNVFVCSHACFPQVNCYSFDEMAYVLLLFCKPLYFILSPIGMILQL